MLDQEHFPQLTGPPRLLDDDRTCLVPVKLEPGKVYAIWLNSENFQGFRDRAGHSAVPYLLIFQTRK
jgi:RNA polymerase sigma-70 factor (ECF subfamily)